MATANRKQLREAVYEVIRSAATPITKREILSKVKAKVPHLCDDSIPCTCGRNHPLWKHLVAWAILHLKLQKLIRHVQRGVWEIAPSEETTTKELDIEERPASRLKNHDLIKELIYEIGQLKGRYPRKEHPLDTGELVDVTWRRIERGNPYAAFEVQIGGDFFKALAKLKHAYDSWNSRPFLVTTEKYRKKAMEWVKGSFHEIAGEIRIVSLEEIRKLHKLLKKAREIEQKLSLL